MSECAMVIDDSEFERKIDPFNEHFIDLPRLRAKSYVSLTTQD